ncbi:MAG: hypothetical protein J6B94_04570 [Lachnospiraceae bacterium]|nr:hypothetical protein [Lachnospiraceae bacterium]
MSKKKKGKVVKYKKPFNIANVFFGAILVYMVIYLYMFLTSTHISGYEVIAGSLATNKQFTGLVLRTEEIFTASTAGYIDYYATEGSKVSGASIVYSVDESGRMSEYLEANSEEINLSEANFTSLKSDISSFSSGYEKKDFSEVYDFHDTVNGNILELANQTLLSEMEALSEADAGAFQRVYAEKSGIVEYHIDGFESVTPQTVTPEMFDKSTYETTNLRSVDLISAGDTVYKLVTDENWSMVIPLTEDQMEDIAYKEVTDENGNVTSKQRSVIEVKFLKDNTTSWGYITILNMNGQQYLQLDFNNSMVRFAGDRYLDIQFLIDDTSGLKIPSSSITTKEFFIIPEEYIMKGGEDDSQGFMVETFDEEGHSTQQFVTPTFYSITDGMVYIDPNQGSFTSNETYIKAGDRIIIPNSNDLYQVGNTAELEGVYCINQGYTQFRKIEMLYANEEYTIVKEGTTFGLTIYDRIVLNAEAVEEDQVIY